jgi:hypothetical protein
MVAVWALLVFAATPCLSAADFWSRAACLHVILAAGIMPLIMTAMIQFGPVLTRSREPGWSLWLLPLSAMAAGVTAALSLAGIWDGRYAAAGLALAAALALLAWLRMRRRRSVGGAHPCLAWYEWALGCLALGLAAVLLPLVAPGLWPTLRRFHMHVNILGFVGMTAVGTLYLLLPTAGGYSEPGAAARLRKFLAFAAAGSLCVAAGAAAWRPVMWLGTALWALPLVSLLGSLGRREIWRWHEASASLGLAAIGFGLVFLSGALHAAGMVRPAVTVGLLFFAFLLPLVSGALSYLLPVWLWPGAGSEVHRRVRQRLMWGSALRAGAFLAAASLWAGGVCWSIDLALATLGLFLLQVIWALWGVRGVTA